MANSSGSEVSYYDYDVYGTTQRSSVSTDIPYKFTGQEFDQFETTGMYNFRARFYSDSTAIFNSDDPAHSSTSPYGYVGGNPVSFTDPTGMVKNPMAPPPDYLSMEADWLDAQEIGMVAGGGNGVFSFSGALGTYDASYGAGEEYAAAALAQYGIYSDGNGGWIVGNIHIAGPGGHWVTESGSYVTYTKAYLSSGGGIVPVNPVTKDISWQEWQGGESGLITSNVLSWGSNLSNQLSDIMRNISMAAIVVGIATGTEEATVPVGATLLRGAAAAKAVSLGLQGANYLLYGKGSQEQIFAQTVHFVGEQLLSNWSESWLTNTKASEFIKGTSETLQFAGDYVLTGGYASFYYFPGGWGVSGGIYFYAPQVNVYEDKGK